MASNITCGGPLIRRACPTKCFGYGEVVDVYLQAKRDGVAAKRFFKRLLRNHGGEPRKIVTDKLGSYGVAHRELIPETIHSTKQYENNRAEQSYEATRVGSEGCGDSNQSVRHSDSSPRMLRSIIYSTWEGISSGPNIIGISGSVRSLNGVGQWRKRKRRDSVICRS